MKMHQIILAGTILLSIISGSECRHGSNPVDADSISDNSNGLVPFKVGNKWIFRFYAYDTLGNVETTFSDSFVVMRDTVIGKERWYKIPGFKPMDIDYLDWYTNRSDGIWVRRKYYDSSITYLTFKFPTVKDDYWGNQIQDSTRVLSTSEVVSTPSGTYTCIRYEDHYEFSQLGDVQYYFAPHKGWVQLDLFTQTSSGRLYVIDRRVLINVTLQ
ncbi:MAG: hypothetical protein HY033_08725 [Ignavibacteriae bacterium]|nr:hypothetical protein [Ignavibacteria bacterium]MBI3364977.1 hypothetical protein [Ignavibacteriota bacterium]